MSLLGAERALNKKVPGNMVIGLFHPRFAVRMLAASIPAGIEAPIGYVEHHLAHAVQAHRFGPSDDAAVITADGMGEWTAAATWGSSTSCVRPPGWNHPVT